MEMNNNLENYSSPESEKSKVEITTIDSLTDFINSTLISIPDELSNELDQKQDMKADILNMLEKSYNWKLQWDLSEFNSDIFDKDWIEWLSEYEHKLYSQALKTSIEYIIQLDGLDKYENILEDTNDDSFYNNPIIATANFFDAWEYLLWDEKSKSYTKMAFSAWNYSEEELRLMWEKDFDILNLDSIWDLGILLGKELGEWIEDLFRLVLNIPSSVFLLWLYGRYRLDSYSSDPIEAAEWKLRKEKLVEENMALSLVELLGEKWIQMIKMLWEKMTSWKTWDIAMTLVMIAWLLAWWAWLAKIGSNLARKSAVKNARAAGKNNRSPGWREYRNRFKKISWTAENIYQAASKADDIIWGAGLGHLTWAFANNAVSKSENVWDSRNIENQNQVNQQMHSQVESLEKNINLNLRNQKQIFDLEDNTKMNVILWDSWEIVIHKSNGKYYIYSEWPDQKDKNLANQLHAEGVKIIHKDAAHIIELGDSFDLWKWVRNFNIWWDVVSANHLTIKNINGKIEIEDHSTNGTSINNYKEKTLNYNLHNQSEVYQLNSHEPIKLQLWELWLVDIMKDDRWNYFASRNGKYISINKNVPLMIWRNSNLDLWFRDISTNHLTIECTDQWVKITDHSTNGTQVLQHNTKNDKERVNIWREVSDKKNQREKHEIYLKEKEISLDIWDEVYIKRSSWSLERWWTIEWIDNGEYILESSYIDWNWKQIYLTRNSLLEEIYTVNEIEKPKSWDASWDEVSEMKKRSFEHIEHNSTLSKESYDILFNWDILKQQNVGNCYLISALNSLRKSPHYEAIVRLSIKKVNWWYNIKVPLWDKNWQIIFVNLNDIQPQKNINYWIKDWSWNIDSREYLQPIDWPEWLKLIEAAYWKMITSQKWKQWEVLNRLYMEGWLWEKALMELLWNNSLVSNNITWEWLFKLKWPIQDLASKWDKIVKQVENFLDNFHPWKDIATVNTMRSQQWHDSKYIIDGIEFYNSHSYSITNVDKFNKIVHVTNPWNAHEVIPLTYNQFMRVFSDTSSVEIKPDRFLK